MTVAARRIPKNHPKTDITRWINPFTFQKKLWPQFDLYNKQRDIHLSVERDNETYVTSCNMGGKDFLAGLICVSTFLRCLKLGISCRIVTHSVAEHHLKVMWAEIARFITTSKEPLLAKDGGPLILNYMEVRRASEADAKNPINYLIGRVSDKAEGLAGHHAEYTLYVEDEASGGDDEAYEAAQGWANHMYIFGNPNPCNNYYFRNWSAGDLEDEDNPGRYLRKTFNISADDSPNVRYAKKQIAAGIKPDNTIILPGVIDYAKYVHRRRTWKPERQCVGLDGKFWTGGSQWMFPSDWLIRAQHMAEYLDLKRIKRVAKGLGVDPAEGGDDTSFCVVDEYGIIELDYRKTPDTSKIKGDTVYFMRKYGLNGDQVCFDRGGGGKQIADELRAAGHDVRTVGFGERATRDPQYGMVTVEEKVDDKEERFAFKNRRAQMYHALRVLLDPSEGLAVESDELDRPVSKKQTFAIPRQYEMLFEELRPVPIIKDGEGVIALPPKNKPNANYKGPTLCDLIGRSPDRADSLVLAVHAMETSNVGEIGVL